MLPPGYSISVTYTGTLTWTWANNYAPYQYPPVYAAENLITAQASPNNLPQQLPGNVYAASRALAGCAAGLAVGVSN